MYEDTIFMAFTQDKYVNNSQQNEYLLSPANLLLKGMTCT